MSARSFRPLHDHVLVRPLEDDSNTQHTILMPDCARQSSSHGEVLAVGPGLRSKTGMPVRPSVAVEDRIYFEPGAGVEVKLAGETLMILRESEIFAVVRRRRRATVDKDTHVRAVIRHAQLEMVDKFVPLDPDDDIFNIRASDPNLIVRPGRGVPLPAGD